MERIQQAIAKARAAREGRTRVNNPDNTAQDVASDLASSWMDLVEVHLNSSQLEAARVIAHHPGPGVKAFDLMRTNLLKHLREHDWKRVAITSPSSGCGKTTICLNLAFSLARQSGLRVLLLEMDLRRPSIVKRLGIDGNLSFAKVLTGNTASDKGLIRIGMNLGIGANADLIANPAELLSSPQAAAAIDAIETRYKPDVILFDLPPVLVIDDTLAFLDQVDCALVVAAAEESTVAEIDRAGKELSNYTKVLGVILNKCRFLDRAEGYGADDY